MKFQEQLKQLSLSHDTVLAFDFDELAIPIHMSRTVTDPLAQAPDEDILNKLGRGSVEGVHYIVSLYAGTSEQTYLERRNLVCKETPFVAGFPELIAYLQSKVDIVFISSGLRDIALQKLQELGIAGTQIIGSVLNIQDGVIAGSGEVVTAEMKGDVVQYLKKERKVIAVGHSTGDKYMLDAADISIALNPSRDGLAEHEVYSVNELQKLLGVLLSK